MTTVVTPQPALPVANGAVRATRPTFLGVLRGEFFKLLRQRLNWWMVLGVTVITLVPYLVAVLSQNNPRTREALLNPPQLGPWYVMTLTLALQRVLVGIFLLTATARMVGLDFQQGTIRVLLARGVGRLQLLGAKLCVMALVGLGLFAWGIVLNIIGALVLFRAIVGNLDPITALTPTYWVGARIDVLTVLVSIGVSILLAAAVTIVTRSLAYGLAGALGWFAADNIVVPLLSVVNNLTNSDFWLKVTAYLLGPELNVMPSVVVPALTITGTVHGHFVSRLTPAPHLGITPLVSYDGRHALMVALVYGVVFAASAVLVMWRRDVLE
jgi:ABC-type transport system involved in multi-copper enzyme maturation permease subunit